MATVNIHQAKTQLSKLIQAVNAGEDVVIARAGRPVARLVPVLPDERPRRVLGTLDGQFEIPDDFDTMFAQEILEMFEGR